MLIRYVQINIYEIQNYTRTPGTLGENRKLETDTKKENRLPGRLHSLNLSRESRSESLSVPLNPWGLRCFRVVAQENV